MNARLLFSLIGALFLTALYLFFPTASGKLTAFILQLRAEKLLTMLLLAVSGGVATLIFQTLTGNRILTPSLMGMDGIYLLLQVALIASLGSANFGNLNPQLKFLATTAVTMGSATLLYVVLLQKLRGDLYRLLLIGVILSVFCRSLTGFISRLLDPTAYAIYQSVAFADISKTNHALLSISTVIIAVLAVLLWRGRHQLDIIALGRESAINLGVRYRLMLVSFLLATSLLVALATALVGPMLFFGLLASALTYRLFPTARHSILIPAIALVSYLILVSGQLTFERLLHFGGTLSMAVECLGGLLFLVLILAQKQP